MLISGYGKEFDDPIYDAMTLAVDGELWKGSTDRHSAKLQKAWNKAWDALKENDNSTAWDVLMREQYSHEIAQYQALSMRKLRAVLRIMSYESGAPFYCAVVALGNKLGEKK